MANSKKQTEKPKAVYSLSRPSRCYNCDGKLLAGAIVKLQHDKDEREVLCQNCSGLQDFEVLSSGNAKLTKLAPKYSSIHYVILKWFELWKCYERQGLLVPKEAMKQLKDALQKTP